MILTPRLQKAIDLAALLHANQKRKGENKLPFIVHPFSVLLILLDYTREEDVLIAAILHDVLEDVGTYTEAQLLDDFGERPVKLVKAVSEIDKLEDKKTTSWDERKKEYINRLSNAPEEALLIAAADKIHNFQSFLTEYQAIGEKMWERFDATPRARITHYDEVIEVINTRLESPLVQILNDTFSQLKEEIKK